MWLFDLLKGKPGGNARAGSRLRLADDVDLVLGGVHQPARLVELSAGGARLLSQPAPRIHERVVFEWHGRPFSGQVIWVKGRQFGLELDGPDHRWTPAE